MIYKQKKQQQNKRKKLLAITVLSLIAIAIIITALELTNVTHFFHHRKVYSPHTANQYTKGEGPGASTGQNSSGNTSNGSSNRVGDTYTNTKGQSDTPPQNQVTLIAPTGNFVSAHQFSLASNPPIGSTCQTTPKATCQITFTNGSKTVQLDKQTTDDGGAAYWTWKPQDVGLTAGTWKVQAIAQLGTQTQTATDANNLQITP